MCGTNNENEKTVKVNETYINMNESNLTDVSDIELYSFMSDNGNESSTSEVPLELSNLSKAKATPPPAMTFRKRRSMGTPKSSPVTAVRVAVPPPLLDKPPVKKTRVSPNALKVFSEGPVSLVPLKQDTAAKELSANTHSINTVLEERPLETEMQQDTSKEDELYHSFYGSPSSRPATGMMTPDEYFTPVAITPVSPENDKTIVDLGPSPLEISGASEASEHDKDSTPDRDGSLKKRVSFSPKDTYIASGKKTKSISTKIKDPFKFFRPSTPKNSFKPLSAEHITDSVRLARQRVAVSFSPKKKFRDQAVQVDTLYDRSFFTADEHSDAASGVEASEVVFASAKADIDGSSTEHPTAACDEDTDAAGITDNTECTTPIESEVEESDTEDKATTVKLKRRSSFAKMA